jgi:hypothetical protein
MSGSDMAGDLVEAALVSRVAEPHAPATQADDGHTHESACLNCGALLAGPFCQQCGQAAHVHRTLGAFFHDLLHGVFHFEGRIWRTLPMLALHPGELTRRYIEGQRARYISPLALFLFCAFLMFAAIQQMAHGGPNDVKLVNGRPVAAQALNTQLDKLVARRDRLAQQHGNTAELDSQIARMRAVRTMVKPDAVTDAVTDEVTDEVTDDKATPAIIGIPEIDTAIAKVRRNPELALYKVETHAYKYSWMLIPISVPFVWLLFPFSRRFKLYDHTVFVTYSLSFMTLLFVVIIAGDAAGWQSVGMLVLLAPVHMYLQLRGAYGCSRPGAVLRTFALVVIAAIALSIFASLIVAESADIALVKVGL